LDPITSIQQIRCSITWNIGSRFFYAVVGICKSVASRKQRNLQHNFPITKISLFISVIFRLPSTWNTTFICLELYLHSHIKREDSFNIFLLRHRTVWWNSLHDRRVDTRVIRTVHLPKWHGRSFS
jgi:hypothetical protein